MAITKRVTLEQFLQLPEERPDLEYIDGMVTQKVSPTTSHNALQLDLALRFNAYAVPRRLARAFPEQRVTFAGAVRVPDVAVFTWDRIPTRPDGELEDDVRYPPEIAVEIFSPGQTVKDAVDRCRWYVDNGVRVALFVHPYHRTVTVVRLGVSPEVLRGADRVDLGDVISSFVLATDELFAALRAR